MHKRIGRVRLVLLGCLRAVMAACIGSAAFTLGQILRNVWVSGPGVVGSDFLEFIGITFVAVLVLGLPVAIAGGVWLAFHIRDADLNRARARAWAMVRGATLGTMLGVGLGLFIVEAYFRRGDLFGVAYALLWGVLACTLAGTLAGGWLWGDLARIEAATHEV
jgi:hypothetical protein